MQKIALQRVNQDGSRHYLSAAGPIPGTPGVVAPPAPGMSTQAGTHPLLFQSPRIRDEVRDGERIISDEVDDYLCWTIVGICEFQALGYISMSNIEIVAKFQYTFFDAFGQNSNIPELPITPFPTLFQAPVYRPANNTVELTVSNFFFENPKTRQQSPLDVYLGNLGPLRLRVYQATPPGPMTNVSPYVQSLQASHGLDSGGPSSDSLGMPITAASTQRYIASGPLHTIVIVEMPPLTDVIKALEDDALPAHSDNSAAARQSPEQANQEASSTTAPPPPPSIAGRSLPLLFIRASDGVGYHSGRTIACENVFQTMDLGGIPGNPPNGAPGNIDTGWLAAADGGLHGWTLRVM